MKIRNGFVSNSSTSSFICNICGEVEAGMDLCLSDVEMECCKNGHYYHTHCLNNKDIKEDIDALLKLREKAEVEEGEDGFSCYEIPSEYCPICQMIVISDEQLVSYIVNKFNIDLNKIKKDMKEEFLKNKEAKNENT